MGVLHARSIPSEVTAMPGKTTISYPRSPSAELRALLMPGEFLAPLIDLNGRKFRGMELDVHFRAKDEVQVYCGLSRILAVRRLRGPDGYVVAKAHTTYAKQPCAKSTGLLRRWRCGERGFSEATELYLNGVKVNPRFTEGEGAVQSRWSRVEEPWVPFDREAVLAYESREHREAVKQFPEVQAAREVIQAQARQMGWKKPQGGPRKTDQLALDSDGRLVLLELKEASTNDDKVYYAPLQLLEYVWEWHAGLEAVRADLQELIDARVAVGLTPPGRAVLMGGIRAAVGFGADLRTPEVKRRYDIALDIANAHLPPGVVGIETWAFAENVPRRLV